MMASRLRAVVVQKRVTWIRQMVAALRTLPAGGFDEFLADSRNVAAAESYVRRALESLLDPGRHILAKGFGVDATQKELFDISVQHVQDIEMVLDALLGWVRAHPDRIDRAV